MNVLIAIPCLLRGGTEMQTLYLSRALVGGGHDVEIACYFQYDPVVVEEFRAFGCSVTLMELERSSGAAAITRSLVDHFATRRPDIVHVQYMAPGAMPVLAARLAGVRRVLATVHQPYTKGHGMHAKLLLRSAALLCDYFIAVSEVAEKSWFGSSRNIADIDSCKLPKHFTIYNAVDAERVRSLVESENADALRRHYALNSGFVFGFIGRISYEKGLDVLFDAFELLIEQYPSVFLLVVGDGPGKAKLEQRYGCRSWWKMVKMIGSQSWEDAMRHFSVMDAMVMPSRFEGFGLSAIEAMSAAVPIIASKTGGLAEIIENGQSGLLFETDNSVALYSEMVRLLTESEFLKKLVVGASERVCAFKISRYNSDILKLYNVVEK